MRILLGMANADIEADLRQLLEELDGTEVVGVAHSSGDLLDYAARFTPDVCLIHENLGPEPVHQTLRDLGVRHPSVGLLQISSDRMPATVIRAMENGARGVIAHPFSFEDLSAKVLQAHEWSVHMKQVLRGAIAQASGTRGQIFGFVGAKGGVGTTTLATHLAMDHLMRNPSQKVCLVDLDLEKGDVSAILEVRQTVSLADLAKVHQDLSVTTVLDAIVQHESGLNLLLTPADVRLTEFVTPDSLRPIFALLRREFDLIIVDGGGSVTPSQAALVELADEVVVVTTSDVLAVRAMRKRMLAWEALGVTTESAAKIIINKVDRSSVFPASAVPQLTSATVLQESVPVSVRALEGAMNERDPRGVTEVAWWKLMTDIRRELGLEAAIAPRPRRGRRGDEHAATDSAVPDEGEQATDEVEAGSRRGRGARRSRGRRAHASERGSIALENVAMLPLTIFMALAAWQVIAIGLTFLMTGHASRVAAREYAVTGSESAAQALARETTPWMFGGEAIDVSVDGSRVTLRMDVPAAGPASLGFPQRLTSTRAVVSER